MRYDTGCWDLAVSFIDDSDIPESDRPKAYDELAQEIQTTIEDFLHFRTSTLFNDANAGATSR